MKKILFILFGLIGYAYGQNTQFQTYVDSSGGIRSRLLINGSGGINTGLGGYLTRPNAANSFAGDFKFDPDTNRLVLNIGANQYVKILTSLDVSGGGGGVTTIANADGTLTISPTSGSSVASLALGHANTWTATQTIPQVNIPLSGGSTVTLLNGNSANVLFSVLYDYPGSGTNVANQLYVIPKGTGQAGDKTDILMLGTDYVAGQTNYEMGYMRQTGSAWVFNQIAGGSGTVRPISIYTGSHTDQLKLNIDGTTSLSGLKTGTGTPTMLVHLPDSSIAQMPYPSGGGSLTLDQVLTNGHTSTQAATFGNLTLPHLITNGSAPTTTSLGTNVTSATVTGTDGIAQITLTTSGAVNGTVFVLTYNTTFGATPKPLISCVSNNVDNTCHSLQIGGSNATSSTIVGTISSAGIYVYNIWSPQ